jgi:alpha,alpha-trehalase
MSTWSLVFEGYDPDQEGLRETLCALGNGVFTTRGACPEVEADGTHYPGTYAGGVYNRLTTDVEGRGVENEDLVNLPNWLPLTFRVDGGPWFHIDRVELAEYTLELDMRRGVLTRLLRFRDGEGRRTTVSQRRLVSMDDPRIAALETTITPLGWSGELEVLSAIDGRVQNGGVPRYRGFASRHLAPVDDGAWENDSVQVTVETTQSHVRIAEAARARVFRDGTSVPVARRVVGEPGYAGQILTVPVGDGEPVRVEKVVAIVTSRLPAVSEAGIEAQTGVSRAGDFEELLRSHVQAWDHIWHRCELRVEGSERAGQILNLHVFHLVQTVSEHSSALDVGVPARGLHGEAYRGHIFWDELFIFPFLNYRYPELTRALLLYRYRRLPEARWAAREEGHRGAMYPWQSGSNGREESQLVHLNPESGRWIPDNSRLQRHIGLAVAYNVWQYFQATGDIDFLVVYGAEMLVEIARFWASLACYDHQSDRYRILRVMGPDEYHDAYPGAEQPGLDDNAYTNVMAVWILLRAREALDLVREDRSRRLRDRLGLQQEELEEWDSITRKMRVPFHDQGIISQFDGYERLEEFDWEGYQLRYHDIQRLDRVLEAEGDTPNRYKASKQADVLMLFYLLRAEELEEIFTRLGYPWDRDMIPRNVAYYRARTSHGSTLSWVVHAWVLSRSNRPESWDLFHAALESDVGDIQGGTTPEGIHLGAMAGTIDLIQRCYAGLEPKGDVLCFNPDLPEQLESIEFRLIYQGRWLDVRIEGRTVVVTAEPDGDSPVAVEVGGRLCLLAPGETAQG